MAELCEEMERLQLTTRYHKLKSSEKSAIMMELLEASTHGRLQYGALKQASEKWRCSVHTVYRAWKQYSEQRASATTAGVSFTPQASKSGRRGPSEAVIQGIYERMASLQIKERGDLRSLSGALDIPTSPLQRYVKSKIIKVCTVTLKPSLSNEQMQRRMNFISSFITVLPDGPAFTPMFDRIHLNEKWFFLKKTKRLPHPQAHAPLRRRDAGTLEPKFIPANKKAYKQMLMADIHPSIKAKWPWWCGKNVVLQHDNATPHQSVLDADFAKAASADGWDITVEFQPPQSPDFNVLDLGVFFSIQSLQFKDRVETLEGLIARVKLAYETLSSETLENTFLTLQQVMHSVLKVKRGNRHKLLRMQKKSMQRLGILTTVIDIDVEFYGEIASRGLNVACI